MWHELKFDKVEKIEKCVAEFTIWMHTKLPYGKMKVKIYEDQDKTFTGVTDVEVKRKFDGNFEGAIGFGKTVEEALSETIKWFNEILEADYPENDYPEGLSEEHIQYGDWTDF